MATFTYKAIDLNGKQVADRIVASDRASAIDELFSQDLNPVSVEKLEERQPAGFLLPPDPQHHTPGTEDRPAGS